MKINIEQSFDEISEHWSPKVIGRVNDQYVKIAKVKGEFVWHNHADEDELFLIVRGRLRMQLEGDLAQRARSRNAQRREQDRDDSREIRESERAHGEDGARAADR